MKIVNIIDKIFCFVIGNTLGRLLYSNKYLKGKHFKNIRSEGWRWVTKSIWTQKICGYNRNIRFPVNFRTVISSNNIKFDPDDLNNFQHYGCYYQNSFSNIEIGKGTYIAPNVGIITANHDINNLDNHLEGKPVVIGKNCWIGMNSVILPGVILGNHTIVGAGSVVTKSFHKGNCIIGGNPAKIIRIINDIEEGVKQIES